MSVGKKNAYTCPVCKRGIITLDTAEGTTPFMIKCETVACSGNATSSFYNVDQTIPHTHEWYRATDSNAANMTPAAMRHHLLGGLFLRKVTS